MADNPNPPQSPFWSGAAKYLPLALVGATLIADITRSEVQIGANSKAITANAAAIELRVPQFLYAKEIERIDRDIIRVAEQAEGNEEVLDKVEDATDQIESQIELEVERLRNQIERSEREQSIQLENILRILETQTGRTRPAQ